MKDHSETPPTSPRLKADVCLFLEGTYPYIYGGVSSWVHELIRTQDQLTFYIVSILPPRSETRSRYSVPSNVVKIENIFLQELPLTVLPSTANQRKKFFEELEVPLLNLQTHANLKGYKKIIDLFNAHKPYLGAFFLLDSEEAWNMIQRMYLSTMGETSFLHYFWSWRSLMGAFYSVLLADLPEAAVYHTVCTGYAGLFLARAHLETGRPCLITEHGIYTNERRIEITASNWLEDRKALNLNIERSRFERDLKDYWVDSFSSYSRLCYEACSKILTIYEGNRILQTSDGADPSKIQIIPNGINYDLYASIPRNPSSIPTVALIGRVVPIKDIKTFIRAIAILTQWLPALHAWILGPTDEDPEYFEECIKLTKDNHLENILTFTGKVNLKDYMGKIDVLVLTSISEAQPLVLLEAGAAGIPCVTTNVGACQEILFGTSYEIPNLGQGGCLSQLSNPESVAENIFKLLTDKEFYQACSHTLKERVKKYYNESDWRKAYYDVYETAIKSARE